MEPNDRFKTRLETAKLWSEYLKHLTTLSTGSILLVATFLEKVFAHPQWKWAVVTAITGFLISVIGSVLALTMLALNIEMWDEGGDPNYTSGDRVGRTALYLSWSGFAIGIVSVASFSVKNILLSN